MPRQVLELVDYFAPLAALVMVGNTLFSAFNHLINPLFGQFALTMLIFAFCLINFFYITERDDLTVFEKVGEFLFSFDDSDSLVHRTIFALARTQ